jgi:6-pyruvoyltetrahydropterin/6-carboxytetrahydropterin synthase
VFQSTKLFDGYSTCFRQWKAEDTHCKFLHGYAISFKVYFEGTLDERNWVWDFGGMKRAKGNIDNKDPKEWLEWLFDHTVIIAEDDPSRREFEHLDAAGVIQLRTLPAVGAEKFAEYLHQKLNEFVVKETEARVRVAQVEVFENNKNSAIYQSAE